MARKHRWAIGAALLACGVLGLNGEATAEAGGVKAGFLTCNVSSGFGFVFGSSRELRCTYAPKPSVVEHYNGSVKKFGVDIGFTQSAVVVWAVLAPTADLAPGALAGSYGGVTGGASVGIGAAANVLVGGSNNTISLQPVSIEGNTGLNVAAGIAAIDLEFTK